MPTDKYVIRLTVHDIEMIDRFISCHCNCIDRIHSDLVSEVKFVRTEKAKYDEKTLHEKLTDLLWYAVSYEEENYKKCFPAD